jgi:hypothetical protein
MLSILSGVQESSTDFCIYALRAIAIAASVVIVLRFYLSMVILANDDFRRDQTCSTGFNAELEGGNL